MRRPKTRPDKPMGLDKIIEMVYEHFIIDKGKRCVDLGGRCKYTNGVTGCFVGFMLTEDDAKRLDRPSGMGGCGIRAIVEGEERKSEKEILCQYFEDSPEVWKFLAAGQVVHDASEDEELKSAISLYLAIAGILLG